MNFLHSCYDDAVEVFYQEDSSYLVSFGDGAKVWLKERSELWSQLGELAFVCKM